MLRKIATFIVTASLLVLGLMFSALLLAVVAVAVVTVWVYLWWKTRNLRRQMRNHQPGSVVFERSEMEGKTFKGEVIEGEVIREVITRIER